MDQSVVAGVGNIYRAEILYKAGIHPDTRGNSLTSAQWHAVWYHTKDLLLRGVQLGSIVTVDEEEGLPAPWTRRYIYNQSSCGRCGDRIQSWQIASRTAYCCPTCQPLLQPRGDGRQTEYGNAAVFPSHCARDDMNTMIHTPEKLTIKQLKAVLDERNIAYAKAMKKGQLVDLVKAEVKAEEGLDRTPEIKAEPRRARSTDKKLPTSVKRVLDMDAIASAADAAAEKRKAMEKRNVEHVPVETDF